MEHVSEAKYAANRLRDRLEGDFRDPQVPLASARYLEVQDAIWALRQAAGEARHWIDRFKVANRGRLLTNWDLRSDLDRKWLDSATLSREVTCSTCDQPLRTEGDFSRHYVIPDLRYPDTGYCWTREGDKRMGEQA